MWFNQGISLDDSNFDMENYSSLVNVKKKRKFQQQIERKIYKISNALQYP